MLGKKGVVAMGYLGAGLLGYLLGSIPLGYLMGRLRGIDVRNYGSGATGGTNVLRTLGWGFAIFTALGDIFKGTLAVYLGQQLGGDWAAAIAGLSAVLGHSYPVWLGFRGGKSVATGGGAVLYFMPVPVLIGVLLLVGTVALTKYVSLGSLVAAASLVVATFITGQPAPVKVMTLLAVAIVYIRHWQNIQRLLAGKENKFGQKAKIS